MERRSEIVDGLETLREAILGYDAAADPKGTAWDVLRIELDRSVLALIDKAGRMERYVEVPVWAKGAAAGLGLEVEGSAATAVKFVAGVDLATSPSTTSSVVVQRPPLDKVSARIGKLFRVGCSVMRALDELDKLDNAEVQPAPYLLPAADVRGFDASCCLVRPKSRAAAEWLDTMVELGIEVTRGGQPLDAIDH